MSDGQVLDFPSPSAKPDVLTLEEAINTELACVTLKENFAFSPNAMLKVLGSYRIAMNELLRVRPDHPILELAKWK